MNFLASATVISDLAADFAPYATAGFTLVAAVLAAKVGFKWLKGMTSRAS